MALVNTSVVYAALVLSGPFVAAAADWNRKLAADFLDGRQKQWFEWAPAARTGGPCLSCHTGVPYLLARPPLRSALGDSNLTSYELGLAEGFRLRLQKNETMFPKAHNAAHPTGFDGVDAVFGIVALPAADPNLAAALDRLWAAQIREGDASGAWPWINSSYQPYESEHAGYFGASLAAVALGSLPAGTLKRSADKNGVDELNGYLKRTFHDQPLHNQLMALWAGSKQPNLVSRKTRESILKQVWKLQRADGSWTARSLGPWANQPAAPVSGEGSNYATALVSFVVQETGSASCSDPGLKNALHWLASQQDAKTGAWRDVSMNKVYPPQSMPAMFMDDAATGFAVMSLLKGNRCE